MSTSAINTRLPTAPIPVSSPTPAAASAPANTAPAEAATPPTLASITAYVQSVLSSPVESANAGYTYVATYFREHTDDLLKGTCMAVWGMVTASVATSAFAGKTIITLLDINLIAAGTSAASAAIIGPLAIAFAAVTYLSAQKLAQEEDNKKFLLKWSWVVFVPLAALAWATSTPLITVIALGAITYAGAMMSQMVGDKFVRSNAPETSGRRSERNDGLSASRQSRSPASNDDDGEDDFQRATAEAIRRSAAPSVVPFGQRR